MVRDDHAVISNDFSVTTMTSTYHWHGKSILLPWPTWQPPCSTYHRHGKPTYRHDKGTTAMADQPASWPTHLPLGLDLPPLWLTYHHGWPTTVSGWDPNAIHASTLPLMYCYTLVAKGLMSGFRANHQLIMCHNQFVAIIKLCRQLLHPVAKQMYCKNKASNYNSNFKFFTQEVSSLSIHKKYFHKYGCVY